MCARSGHGDILLMGLGKSRSPFVISGAMAEMGGIIPVRISGAMNTNAMTPIRISGDMAEKG